MNFQPHASRLMRVDPEHPDRWWTRFIFWHCLIVLTWIAAGLIFTPESSIDHRYTAHPPPPPKPGEPMQHPESSLGQIHHLLPLRWWVWGVVFAVFVVGLCFRRTRGAAYFGAGCIAALFIAVSIEFTYFSGSSTNAITVPLSTLAPDALLAGFRYSILPPRVAHSRREQP